MGLLKSAFKNIVYYFTWETVYATQEIGQYAKVKGKLYENNIMTKTKIIRYTAQRTFYMRVRDSYEILVKPEAVHIANQIIHEVR